MPVVRLAQYNVLRLTLPVPVTSAAEIKDGQSVDGRSIMGLMMLAASFGSEVEICAEGPDAAEALKAMLALAEAKFGEE